MFFTLLDSTVRTGTRYRMGSKSSGVKLPSPWIILGIPITIRFAVHFEAFQKLFLNQNFHGLLGIFIRVFPRALECSSGG